MGLTVVSSGFFLEHVDPRSQKAQFARTLLLGCRLSRTQGLSPGSSSRSSLGHRKFNRKAWATRVFGAEGSNRSGSFTWAGKQEKLRSMQLCFFLTPPLIELIRNWRFGCAITTDLQNKCLNEVFDPATQRTLANFQPVPELRHRGGEFKRNITARRLRRNGYDDALLRLIVSLVRYHYSLAGLDTTRHQDQSAPSTDRDCSLLLVQRSAIYQQPVGPHSEIGIK